MSIKQQKIRRESASLIIAAQNRKLEAKGPSAEEDYNYKLLMLKRSERTAIAPNQSVFPGGIFEKISDESVEWLKYFEEFGVTQQSLKQLVVLSEQRPKILSPQGSGCYDRFFKQTQIWAREISLRLTAIRETFEEVGVLLCRNKAQLNEATTNCYGYIAQVDFDRKHWQQIVHNDASEFLRLCQELQVVPDLWGLHEWSAWASPAPIAKGFETVFFMTCLPETPDLLIEESEVKESMWCTSTTFLNMFRNDELWFLPPQIYELSRLVSVKTLQELLDFAQKRSSLGTTLYLPVPYVCTDGIASVLPGDDLYLNDPGSIDKFIKVNSTMAESRTKAKLLHRIEDVGMPSMRIYFNLKSPLDGHLSPVQQLQGISKL